MSVTNGGVFRVRIRGCNYRHTGLRRPAVLSSTPNLDIYGGLPQYALGARAGGGVVKTARLVAQNGKNLGFSHANIGHTVHMLRVRHPSARQARLPRT